MASWSCLGRGVGTALLRGARASLTPSTMRLCTANALRSGHRTFDIQPSRWQWHKFKDMLHYYVMVGLIPVTAITLYANIFIGPATLEPIPDDYEPKHWEYHRHPITRFIARYLRTNPQQEYEKFCHWVDEEGQKVKLRTLEKQIMEKMKQRHDYQSKRTKHNAERAGARPHNRLASLRTSYLVLHRSRMRAASYRLFPQPSAPRQPVCL